MTGPPPAAPRLAICLVVRDGRAGLERSLRALEGQRRPLRACGAELVVVDGESRDGSAERVRAFAAAMAGQWAVRLHSQSPRGIYAAMNEAWRQARAPWLLYLNAGDLLLDGALAAEAIAAAEAAGAASVQCQMAVFAPGARRGWWLPGQPVRAHQALIYRRDLHLRFGPYDERLRVCADTLWMRAIESEPQLIWPRLLAATDVSPADASRDPGRIQHDLAVIAASGLDLQPWPRPRLTLLTLRLERLIGTSASVWLRLGWRRLRGRARTVPLD
ncbi:MAG: glycosyltransferase [Cyanobacteriota bacterium]|nr:glycosyltransferase [Cyanobacteriota bacterium]